MSDLASALKESFFVDLERELNITRTILTTLPEQHFSWKPHEKSMSLIRLAVFTALLPSWLTDILGQDEFDFAKAAPPPQDITSSAKLLEYFDRNVAALRQAVARFDPAGLSRSWTLRRGEQVMATRPRDFVYRVWALNHLIHHRAELGVYLRLLNTPAPAMYFNTANDPTWKFE